MLGKTGKILKDIVTDPAFGFGVGNTLLFASGLGAPFYIALAGAAGIACITGLKSANPKFLQKDNMLTRLLKDDRTPLRLAGISLGAIGGIAALGGAALAAITSTAFMAVDFAIAESIKEQKDFAATGRRAKKSFLNRLFTGPDLYVTIGLTGAAVMTGGLIGAMAAPFIALSSGVALYNTVTGKHESNAHPKVLAGASCFSVGIAGLAQGNPAAVLPSLANITFAGTYLNIESQITEGGLKKVIKDVITSPAVAYKHVTRDRSLDPAPSKDKAINAKAEPDAKIPPKGGLKGNFPSHTPTAAPTYEAGKSYTRPPPLKRS